MDEQRDAARVNLVVNVPRDLSAAEYDRGWLNEWDDMKSTIPLRGDEILLLAELANMPSVG